MRHRQGQQIGPAHKGFSVAVLFRLQATTTMSVQRSPPLLTQTNSVPEATRRQDKLVSDDSDPQLPTNPMSELPVEPLTPNYVYRRTKRCRPNQSGSPIELSSLREDIKELFTSFVVQQTKELTNINKNLKDIQQSNVNIENAVALLTSQNDEFRKKIEQLELQNKKDREYIILLEDKIEDLQRNARKSSIELKNVPNKTQENRQDLIKMVTSLASTVNVELGERDIKDVFRVKSKNNAMQNPPIIVELISSLVRTDLLQKTKEFNRRNKSKLQAKHLGLTKNEETPVFISEQLTARGARLYFLARDLEKSKKYKYCWTAFGKVFVRKDDNSKIIHIVNESQIQHLVKEI